MVVQTSVETQTLKWFRPLMIFYWRKVQTISSNSFVSFLSAGDNRKTFLPLLRKHEKICFQSLFPPIKSKGRSWCPLWFFFRNLLKIYLILCSLKFWNKKEENNCWKFRTSANFLLWACLLMFDYHYSLMVCYPIDNCFVYALKMLIDMMVSIYVSFTKSSEKNVISYVLI